MRIARRRVTTHPPATAPSTSAAPPFAAATAYDSTVNTVAGIQSAANTAGNAGKTVAIRGGTYGALTLQGSGGHPPTMFGPSAGVVTFIPYPGETVSIAGATYRYARNIRFEGINWTAGVQVIAAEDYTNPFPYDPGASYRNRNLTWYGCTSTGGAFDAYYVQAWSDNITVQGCYIHDLTSPSPQDVGYGVRCSGGNGTNRNITIKQNRFDHLPNDSIQVSSIDGLVIDRNEILDCWRDNQSAHPDGTQMFGVTNWQITNNKYGPQPGNIEQRIFISYQNNTGLIENNLILDSTTVGLSWSSHTPNLTTGPITVRRNTVWGTAGVIFQNTGTAIVTLTDNIFDHAPTFDDSDIAVLSGNQNGGSPNFDADYQSQTYPTKGYVKPTEVWW